MSDAAQNGSGAGALIRWIAPALLAVAFAVHAYVIDCVADDGLISLQYVKHFLLGDGLVYNIDERVEGFTNFLWLAVLGGVMTAAL